MALKHCFWLRKGYFIEEENRGGCAEAQARRAWFLLWEKTRADWRSTRGEESRHAVWVETDVPWLISDCQ